MRPHDDSVPRPRGRRARFTAAIAGLSALALSGCAGQASDGFLPRGATQGAERVTNLWVGSWIAALAVGVLVWGLIIWCAVAYRRRRDDDGSLPVQLRYNVPVEILYTVVPVLMVAVFFYYTQRDESALLDTSKKPDVVVNVIGKQWSWDFNYVNEQVYEAGTHAQLTGKPGVEQTLPTMYLPVNKRTEFQLTARDVIHSFWAPGLRYKMDAFPHHVNTFTLTLDRAGRRRGRCAEFCGQRHYAMDFYVKAVPPQQYDHWAHGGAGAP